MRTAALAEDAVSVRQVRSRGVSETVLRHQLAAAPTPRVRRFVFVRRVTLRAGAQQVAQAMQAALAKLAEDGRQEVLSFADFPALAVACARAALAGGLSGAWHWRILGLPRGAGAGEAIATLLAAHPLEAVSAVAALADQGLLGPVWRDLPEPAAARLTAALAMAAGFTVPDWPDGASDGYAGGLAPASVEVLLTRAAAMWAQVGPLPARSQALLAAAVLSLLRWSPGVLRSPDSPVWRVLLARVAGAGFVPASPRSDLAPTGPEPNAATLAEGIAPPPAEPAAAEALQDARGQEVSTGWGGVLFLINALRRLDVDTLLYQPPLRVTHRSPPVVMVGEGRPSTSFLAAISKDVDGGPEPVLGRAIGPTRGPAMTGEAKPESQPFRPLVLDAAGPEAPTGWRLLHDLGVAFGLPDDEPMAAFLASQDLDTDVPPELLATLMGGIEDLYRAGGPWPLPLAQPARLWATETHLDLDLAATDVDLALRLSGLDLDPGWVPWLGRVVTFNYGKIPTHHRGSG